jgi:hypothetical protein
MAKAKTKPYPLSLLELMASKTAIFMKAQTFAEMGMTETAQPMWAAAAHEQRIAPPLDAFGRKLEAAASRISAASCYQKSGDPSRAANLYQAALAAPSAPTRAATSRRCSPAQACITFLTADSRTALNGASQRRGKVPAGT